MATLYELTGNYLKLLDYAEDMDPTLFHDTLDSIDEAIEDKAVNYAKLSKNMDQRITEIKGKIQPFLDEANRLKKKIATIENNQNNLKNNLIESMQLTGKKKIKTDLFTIWYQDNQPSLNTPKNKNTLPAYYFKTERVLDSAKLKKDLEKGKEVPGASLSVSSSLRIR